MRIRRKPWARPELAASPFCIDKPEELRGKWHTAFKNPENPLFLELGCGKGGFIAQTAFDQPDKNFLALDLKSEMLGLAKRKAEKLFSEGGREVDNLLLAAQNIEQIENILAPEDKIAGIYINFCNPCPKKHDFKHRLTHTRQLEHYKTFLLPGREIRVKTDSDILYEASIEYFEECGFIITYTTFDLPADHEAARVKTEHEMMFRNMGLPIHYIIAKLPERGECL